MKKISDKISVIVPVYNVENYLDKCIESIVNQTYKNLQIILVDDGSTDTSPKKCDEWAKKDERIKIVHKKNGGLSSARNAGIDISQGEFLTFVDSDDWIENNFIEELHKAIVVNNADISICGFKKIEDSTCKILYEESCCNKDIVIENGLDLLFTQKNVTYVVAWNKMYRKGIFNKLRYKEGKLHEDEFIIYDVYNLAKNGVALVNKNLYNYLQRKNSIMGKTTNEKCFDIVEAFNFRLKQVNVNSKYYCKAVQQYLNAYVLVYLRIKDNKQLKKKCFEEYKREQKKFKGLKFDFIFKLKHFIFGIFPDLAILLLYKIIKR